MITKLNIFIRNILLDQTNHIRICDFGISKIMDDDDTPTPSMGTRSYMSPEMLNGRFYDYKTDI